MAATAAAEAPASIQARVPPVLGCVRSIDSDRSFSRASADTLSPRKLHCGQAACIGPDDALQKREFPCCASRIQRYSRAGDMSSGVSSRRPPPASVILTRSGTFAAQASRRDQPAKHPFSESRRRVDVRGNRRCAVRRSSTHFSPSGQQAPRCRGSRTSSASRRLPA